MSWWLGVALPLLVILAFVGLVIGLVVDPSDRDERESDNWEEE